MQRSGSQKALLVISILLFISAAAGILGSLFLIFGVGALSAAPDSETASLIAESGMSKGDIMGMLGFAGVAGLAAAILSIIEGILGIRAANDNQKIKPVYYLAIIGLVVAAIGFVGAIINGHTDPNTMGGNLGSLIGNGLMVWIANNIKKQAGL